MPKQVINVAADDALTQIYRLANDEGEEVIAARLAERLELKPASMAGMLSRLKRDKLVKVDAKIKISQDYRWITLWDIIYLSKKTNYINCHLRTLISHLN